MAFISKTATMILIQIQTFMETTCLKLHRLYLYGNNCTRTRDLSVNYRFTGQTDFIVIRYSETSCGLPKNIRFPFQGKVVKVNRIWEMTSPIYFYIMGLLGLNFGRDNGCPDLGFSWFSSVCRIGNHNSLPKLSKLIIHQSPYHSTLCSWDTDGVVK
jgi:hypothetical protein